jgi:hypothetical protein
MVGLGRGHPWVLNRVGVDPAESPARFVEGIRMLVEIFRSTYIENSQGTFWRISANPWQKSCPTSWQCGALRTNVFKESLLRGFDPSGAAHAEHRVRQPVLRESLEVYAPLRLGNFARSPRVGKSIRES